MNNEIGYRLIFSSVIINNTKTIFIDLQNIKNPDKPYSVISYKTYNFKNKVLKDEEVLANRFYPVTNEIILKMIHNKQHISNRDIFDIIVKEDIDKLFKKLNIENA